MANSSALIFQTAIAECYAPGPYKSAMRILSNIDSFLKMQVYKFKKNLSSKTINSKIWHKIYLNKIDKQTNMMPKHHGAFKMSIVGSF